MLGQEMTRTAPAAPGGQQASLVAGIGFFLAGTWSFGVLDATAKLLTQSYHPLQVTWGRFFFAFVIVLPLAARLWRAGGLASRRPGLQLLRATLPAVVNFLFFVAIQHMQLAEVQAISFIAPLLVTALAALLLGERVGPRRWIAVAIGLCGVLAIIRPGSGVLTWVAGFALAQAMGNALFHLVTRSISAHDPPQLTFVYTATVGAAAATLFVPVVWTWPTPLDWALMVLTGVMGAVGHWFLILAYRRTEASSLAPYMYLQLPWITFLGWLLFGDLPDLWTLLGAAVVISSGIYVFSRERYLRSVGRL
jgi:drug/metabolite transporter (DMT)-like permease